MTCSDLIGSDGRLLHPDELSGEIRERLMQHLDQCDGCRDKALASDPTLVFSLWRSAQVDEGEVASIAASVRVLRRTKRIEGVGTRRRWAAGGGVAVAALIAMAAVLLPTGTVERDVSGPPPAPLEQQLTGFGTLPPVVQESPILEDLDRQEARVYQVDEEGLSIVMVVDESLDL